jgi:small subunit ribosomal protein S17
MSDDEQKKDDATEEAPVQDEDATSESDAGDAPADDENSADDAPAAEVPDDTPAPEEEAPAAEAEPEEAPADPDGDLPWKQRRRLERSRRPSETRPQQSPEERAAARAEARKHKAAERRKERAAAKAKRDGAGAGTPTAERESNAAKVRQGIVVSNKGDKSITVRIDIARRHPTYEKIVRRSRTLHAHDERNEAGEGDVVRVIETRPLSKTKRWRLVDVVEKAR